VFVTEEVLIKGVVKVAFKSGANESTVFGIKSSTNNGGNVRVKMF
jgi:hypothetical protein